jgi:histidyl-tRNA synthetase
MRDFLPAEKAHRDRALATITATYRSHGFDQIETPVVEDSDRLHAGLGGDNEKLAFGVLKRGLTTDDLHEATAVLDLVDLGLRYDLTVPLARFYASHRAELPTVFKAIQVAPVWRAERPQKGRYRQFVQCDIDIIGESGLLAEAELVTATAAALRALGLDGWSLRVNDRRLLTSMLTVFGFPQEDHASVLITIDKLDKIAASGVVAELRARDFAPSAVDALDAFLHRPTTREFLPFGERAIRKALPDGIDETAVHELSALGDALEAERERLVFDPFLVRGMGYYTGAIFEIAHAELGYSIGGGGRYDGMIGRFLGTEVPAVGLSLGFERLVDLLPVDSEAAADSVALLFDDDVQPATLLHFKAELIASGKRVRVEPVARNTKAQLAALRDAGYATRARVGAQTETLELVPIH